MPGGPGPPKMVSSPMNSIRLRQLGGNVFWLVANRIVRMLIAVIVLGAVGRHLGVEQFGQLNYAISLAAVFATVAGLGFEAIVIRELVREPSATGRILCSACALRLLGGLLAIVLVWASSLVAGDHPSQVLLAVIVSVGFLPGALEVIELWFQKNIQAKHTVMVRIVSAILAGGMRLLLVWQGATVGAFAVMQVVETALAAAALVWVYQARGESFREWRFDLSIARRLLRDTWPLMLSGLLVAAYFRVEQILVKQVLGDYSAGIYYASVRVVEMWGFVPVVILTTLYPILVEKHEAAELSARRRQMQIVFDILTALGLLTAVVVTFMAPWLIPLLFGTQYSAAVPVLTVHAWLAPITFSGSVRAQYLLLENANIYHTLVALIGIAVNVPLTLWLMRTHGALGAAWAVLITSWFTGLGTSFLFPKLRPCVPMQLKALLLPFRMGLLREALRRMR